MLTTEQKARAWDQMKKVWTKGNADEACNNDTREMCQVMLESMKEIEQQILKKDSKNDGATGA